MSQVPGARVVQPLEKRGALFSTYKTTPFDSTGGVSRRYPRQSVGRGPSTVHLFISRVVAAANGQKT